MIEVRMTRVLLAIACMTLCLAWAAAAGARPMSASDIEDRVDGVYDAEVRIDAWVIADFNGDGYGDLAMSTSMNGEGNVVVASGAELPWGIMTAGPAMSVVMMSGNMPGEDYGFSLAAGDVTGDGFPDLVVGAPGAMGTGDGGADLPDAGRIYVYAGGDMGSWDGNPFSVILGNVEGARLGEKVATGPLFGNVAKHEVLACAPGLVVDEYPVQLGGLLVWEDLPGNAGMDGTVMKLLGDGLDCSSLKVGPDMVGDAAPDILVGDALANAGRGVVYFIDAIQTMDIGEPLPNRTALTVDPGANVSALGTAVVVATDLGLGGSGADVALGAPSTDSERGAVYLLDVNDLPSDVNQMTTDTALGSIVSDDPFYQVGGALAVTDNFAGLPNSQLWIGAWDSDSVHSEAGAVGLFDQQTAMLMGAQTKFGELAGLIEGINPGGHFGRLLVTGRLDADAHPDVVILEPDSEYGAMYILRSMRFSNADADGYLDQLGDCDDTSDETFPGAEELCDGLDNNCDGELDPSEVDEDGDGWIPCGEPGDCDDLDPNINPGADEICDDEIDNDCDGDKDGDDEECGGAPGDDDDFEPGDDDDLEPDDDDDDVAVEDGDAPAGFHCACDSATPAGPRSAWIALLALGLLRRRR